MARTLMMPEHIRFPRSVTRFLRANPGYTSKFAHLGLPPEQAYFRCRVLADWAIIRPHLPAAVSRVLDIGCGIAGIDLLLYRRLAAPGVAGAAVPPPLSTGGGLAAPRLFLVDKRRRDQGGRSFDVVAMAREFLAANGVPAERIAAFGSGAGDLHEALKKERYDLILSLRGLGYMFPYESYRDTLRQVLGRPGLLILDIRLMDAEALKTDAVAYERFRAVGFPCASRVIRRLGSDFGDAAEIGRSKDYVRVRVKSP